MVNMRRYVSRVSLLTNIGLGLVIVIAGFSYWSGVEYRRASKWQDHSLKVISLINRLQSETEKAETAQRGYIITGATPFLEPFSEAQVETQRDLQSLQKLVSDNPNQTALIKKIKTQLEEKFDDMGMTIQLTQKGEGKKAVAKISEGRGLALMQTLRGTFGEFILAEEKLLEERSSEAEQEFRTASTLSLCGLIIGFIFLGAVTVLLRREISTRAKIQEDLLKAEVKASDASRYKSQFLANMSHEIRTPLNGIIGLSRLLSETELKPAQVESLNTIRDSGNHLLAIINQVLDLSKIESGKLQIEQAHFELRSLIGSTVNMIQSIAAAKGVGIKIHISEDISDFYVGDALRIQQVLINFINNAVKFSAAGNVHIEVQRLREMNERVDLRFEVRDEGIGLTKETIQKLFSPFEQGDQSTTRKYGGTGLGLSISKQLVEMMGGQIGAESLKKGSCFYFEIPLNSSVCKLVLPEHSGTNSQAPLSANLLVVEDNLTNQKVISAMLKKLGLQFEIATNGQLAIEALQTGDFDLLLMDGQMPVMDGYEATEKIRSGAAGEKYRKVPIIAVTANAISEDVNRCFAVGMDDYIAKPISYTDLEQKMRHWLKHGASSLDLTVLDSLKELETEEDPNVMADLIDIFKATGEQSLIMLRKAFMESELKKLEQEAHSFKSTCANIGAVRLQRIVSDIEIAAREANQDRLAERLLALEAEHTKVVGELGRLHAA